MHLCFKAYATRQSCDHKRTQCHSSPTHKPLHLISGALHAPAFLSASFVTTPRSFPSSGRTSIGRRSSSTESLQADPLSARLFPRGVPRGPPHSEPTCATFPITQKTSWDRSPASYAVSFSHLVLNILMARPPCQQGTGTFCISPCGVVKRWRRVPPPKTSARRPRAWHPTWILQWQISDPQAQSHILSSHLITSRTTCPEKKTTDGPGTKPSNLEGWPGPPPSYLLDGDLSLTVSTHLSNRFWPTGFSIPF